MFKIFILIGLIFITSFTIEIRADDPPPPTEITPTEGFFGDIIDFFNGVWDALLCSLKKIMRWLISLVENLFFYILDITSQALLGLIVIIFDLIPDINLNMTPLEPYYAGINYFFPLSETLVIYSSVIIFWFGYLIIRWILRVTPFLG